MGSFTDAEAPRDHVAEQPGAVPDDLERRRQESREFWKVILYGALVVLITLILLGLLRFWMVSSYGGI